MDEKHLPCGRPQNPRRTPSTKKIEEWHEKLRAYLGLSELKYTEQRWHIARLILQTGGHLDALGIVERVKHDFPGIGPATVYRTIKVLCDARLLVKSFEDIDGRTIYELADAQHHDHLICLDCGEIFEFHDEDIEQRQTELARKLKFEPDHHHHVIHAHCAYLKKK